MNVWPRHILAALGVCSVSLAAWADTPPAADADAAEPPAHSGELWLNPGFYAYHFQKHRNLNDNALGFGAEYRHSAQGAFTGGFYRNGGRDTSHYLAYYWRPLALGPVRFGVIAGAVNGYSGTRKGGWFPALLPTASVEYGRIGLNLFLIPTIKDSVNGSLTFQLNVRVY